MSETGGGAIAPVIGTCEAAGGASGINLEGLPPLPDAEALESQAQALSSMGTRLSSGAGDAARRWAGLAGSYQAPEADVVLSGFGPVVARANGAAALLASVAAALNRYAGRSRGLRDRLADLRGSVAALDALILGNDDWQSKHSILNQHRDTYNQVNALAQEIFNSDADCANELRGLVGGGKVSAPVVGKLEIGASKDPFSNVLSHVRHFFGGDEEHPGQSWGPPTPSMRLPGGWAVGQGAVSAVLGSVQGSYTLLGTSDVEEQRQAWQGLGGLVVAGVRTSLAVQRGPSNLSADDVEAFMTVNEAGKSAFYVDRWDKDFAFSAGSLGFDVGSIFLGGGAVVKGGSLGAKAGTLGAKAGPAAEDAASAGSRFVTRLEDLPASGRIAEHLGELPAKALDAVSSMKTGSWDVGIKSELDELKKVETEAHRPDGRAQVPDRANGLSRTMSDRTSGLASEFPLVHEVTESGPGWVRIHPDAEDLDPLYGQPRSDWKDWDPKYRVDVDPATVSDGVRRIGYDDAEPFGHDMVTRQPLTEQEWAQRYIDAEGNIRWAPNGGAVPGTQVRFSDISEFIKHFGEHLDRVGKPNGEYLGFGASFDGRALLPGSKGEDLHRYTLTGRLPDQWKIEVSEAAPAYGRDGGALQAVVLREDGARVSINTLREMGVIR